MAKVEVTMPKMGESITEGTVIAWHKKPGEAIEVDETLLEIGTDKVDTEVPSPSAGVLHEILVEEGDTVEVGTTIALIETDADAAESAAPAEEPAEEEAEPADEAPEPEPAETAAPAPEASAGGTKQVSGGTAVDVVMPKMGESIMEGTIIAWHKQPGDEVEVDETLLEIATDKVDTEVPSPAAGVLKEVLAEEGDTVEVGTRIAVIASGDDVNISTGPAETPPTAEEPMQEPSGDGAPAAPSTGPIERHGSDGRFYSPLVRSIAEEEGLGMEELEQIQGSGREGRVTKEDVLAYLEQRSKQPAPASRQAPAQRSAAPSAAPSGTPSADYGDRVEVVQMDRMRQIIADHMVRSKATSPHVTSFAEADVTNLVRFRERNKKAFLEREGIKLTYTPFFVQAAVEALREHPVFNASVEDKQIIIKKDFHIGMAVAIGKSGLLAPIIRDAGRQNVVGLAHTAADLAQRARSKQLQPDELQGGTFTVTNIGSLGSLMGTPIINQPQVSILATGAIKKRPMVIEHPELGDTIAIRHMMYLSLSYDHRIIDGAMGSSFLRKVVDWLESVDPNGEL